MERSTNKQATPILTFPLKGGRETGYYLKYKHNSGFSLLEVLVAFSIAAVTLGIIFSIYAKGTTAAILGEEYAQAIAIAESRLATLGISEDIEAADTNGIEKDKYHWTIHIDEHLQQTESDFVSPMNLKEVEIEVHWKSRRRDRSIQLKTLKPVFSK